MLTLNECLLIGRNPNGLSTLWPLYTCASLIVPLGPFNGMVAVVPNQTRISLPAMQKTEVTCLADVHFGPDDPTLWPQPWVKMYCHLGSIPRKPEDPNDCLSIMWWNPTIDDFKSLGGSLVDGLGELLGSKLLSLQRMMSSMEGRIKDHKQAFPTNKLLLLLLRAMQDSFTHLNLLKTTFTEMRIGISDFQCYYLEIHGFLDYIKIYKPCMEGARPPAESVTNCMGAIMNIPHSSRLLHGRFTHFVPLAFNSLGQCSQMQHIRSCYSS